FQQYVYHLPDHNYSITLDMARVIDDFYDGEIYIKIWPYWYDGNAVRAQLRRVDQGWRNELERLEPGQPPVAGGAAKFAVILHPDDAQGLETLRLAAPQGIALTRHDGAGRVSMVIYYGQR
ncbi:MAG: hypothetical protein V1772_05915, partial [Chloroflexota bacterium]